MNDAIQHEQCLDDGARAREQVSDESSTVIESDKVSVLSARKKQLLSKLDASSSDKHLILDCSEVRLITQYLANEEQSTKGLERKCLAKIFESMIDSCVEIQLQAIKSVSVCAEVDPSILKRTELLEFMEQVFKHKTTVIKTAVVEMIGKCCIKWPDQMSHHYGILSMQLRGAEPLLKKRVIKIFRDFCLEHRCSDNIVGMCGQMIECANVNSIVRNMVAHGFIRMWFTPCIDDVEGKQALMEAKTNQMLDVIDMSGDDALEWIKYLLSVSYRWSRLFVGYKGIHISQLKKTVPVKVKGSMTKACQQIVDYFLHAMKAIESNQVSKALRFTPLMRELVRAIKQKTIEASSATLRPICTR